MAEEDGIITPAEIAAIEEANQALTDAMAHAQAAVDHVPAGEERTGLQTRLDALSPVDVPAVTDANADGVLDTQQVADADSVEKNNQTVEPLENDTKAENRQQLPATGSAPNFFMELGSLLVAIGTVLTFRRRK